MLHRTSIPCHLSLQHFTSVVISLQTFIRHRVPAKTLQINHAVIFSASTHLRGRGRKCFYFLLPAVIFICVSNSTARLPLSVCSVTENRPPCARRVRDVHTGDPGDQTQAAFEWIFLPSQTRCDRSLHARPAVCAVCAVATDWNSDSLSFFFTPVGLHRFLLVDLDSALQVSWRPFGV